MTDNLVMLGAQRQAALDAAKSAFFARGKAVVILDSCGDGFPPERSDRVDPDTVLKRRRPAVSLSERRALRRMAAEL
ncbi:hypothetical protein SJI00_07215 [Pseudomonas sp. RP23018S]|uniref:hypothetical protein n=1 Tax=Pseudomonas sp. RP23018S TaxID=3096037 RepID=UPI002ACAC441|nr:hypothetical protein [Pseudomonas sp. RP23018S]MDZ5602559.1 hypothetical protein [Pseudomonas sp. RP23018S]